MHVKTLAPRKAESSSAQEKEVWPVVENGPTENNVPGLLTGGAMGDQLDQTGQCSKNSSFKIPQSRA